MKKTSLNYILAMNIIICTGMCTGCVSTSISDSLALIEQESNSPVNQQVLTSIQALRISQPIVRSHRTFTYALHNKELSDQDKISITKLIVGKNQTVTINIAPAKGTNKLHQLALSMERAEVLRLYISHFNTHKVTIKFAPKLTNDTINLETGA